MTVQEFIAKSKNNYRLDIAKELEVKTYTSIALKREMANLVLDNCTTVVDDEVHIDSLEKYILFTLAVIAMHTNLELTTLDDENAEDGDTISVLDEYDMLCESGLLVKIIDTFQEDYAACQEVLNMIAFDRMQNNMTIEKKIYKFIDELQVMLSGAVSELTAKLSSGDLLGNLPVDQLKLLELFNSINNK